MVAGRRVSLVLCNASGEVLGTLPPFTVDDPWWPEAQPVIVSARERFGVELIVLRMLDVTSDSSSGGEVTYLAEVVGEPPPGLPLAATPQIDETPEPRRMPWARPRGVHATIAWADDELAAMGRPRSGPVEQIKTWNLSSVLRLPTADGDVWCKSVPPFLTDEGAIIMLVAADEPTLVPSVLASDPSSRTVLLDDVPGEDDWNAPEDRLRQMVRALVRLQARWTDRIGVLLDAGLPDRRAAPLDRLVDALVSRPDVREQLTDGERRAMDVLVRGLPDRFAALDACGVPETLVHGDFHPGNWRFDGNSLVLLDWGDVCVGHPMLDMSSFEASVPDQIGPRARAAWVEAWSRAHPDADPARASALIPPIAALMRAVVYQRFLDGIEPSERPYHASDVRHWLRTALERAADGAAANADL